MLRLVNDEWIAVPQAEEVEAIGRALAKLSMLAAKDRSPSHKPPFCVSAEVLMRRPYQSEAAEKAESLVEDPAGYAYRHSIETLGQRLCEIGGTGAMEEAAKIADSITKSDHASSIIDKWFDGIGAGEDFWWA